VTGTGYAELDCSFAEFRRQHTAPSSPGLERRAEAVWRSAHQSGCMGLSWTGCNMSSTNLVDIAQTLVLALVAVAQIYTILILRNELSRAAKVLHAMSMAMAEQTDLKRRVNDLENELADLTMRG
jgi:hypothetical protein